MLKYHLELFAILIPISDATRSRVRNSDKSKYLNFKYKNLLIWQKIICLKTDSFLEEEKSDGKLRGHVPAITEIIDRFSQQ